MHGKSSFLVAILMMSHVSHIATYNEMEQLQSRVIQARTWLWEHRKWFAAGAATALIVGGALCVGSRQQTKPAMPPSSSSQPATQSTTPVRPIFDPHTKGAGLLHYVCHGCDAPFTQRLRGLGLVDKTSWYGINRTSRTVWSVEAYHSFCPDWHGFQINNCQPKCRNNQGTACLIATDCSHRKNSSDSCWYHRESELFIGRYVDRRGEYEAIKTAPRPSVGGKILTIIAVDLV